jgi:hypothetical protein
MKVSFNPELFKLVNERLPAASAATAFNMGMVTHLAASEDLEPDALLFDWVADCSIPEAFHRFTLWMEGMKAEARCPGGEIS